MKQYLECGRVVGTHGLRGHVRVEPWCDSAAWLCALRYVFVDGAEFAVRSARIHGSGVLLLLDGITGIDAAMQLCGRVLFCRRGDINLDDGKVFDQDIIGLNVYDNDEPIGTLTDIIHGAATDIFCVTGMSGNERLIPNVPDFVRAIDIGSGRIDVALIEGL